MSFTSGADKARFVRGMFDAIAARYDLMNRLMTGGRDEAWRRAAAGSVSPEAVRVAIDLGAGTGDLSFALARVAPQARVVSLDFSAQMVRLADAKRRRLGLAQVVQPVLGDAMAIPAASGAVDAIVTGFTLRNVADVDGVFRECHRVLRPGGRLAVLELTPVHTPIFRGLFRFYFHRLVPLVGAIVSGKGYAYRYLPESVLRFPDAERLCEMLLAAGFPRATYRKLALGTVALHVAQKGTIDGRHLAANNGSLIGGRWSIRSSGDVQDAPGTPLTIREVTAAGDVETWNEVLSRLPNAHGLQSWEWGELRQEGNLLTRWVTRRMVFERHGKGVAAAAVQRRGLPYPGWGVSYCPKGPVLDYADGELFRAVLEGLAEDTRRQHSLVLTVEPEAEVGTNAAFSTLRAAGYQPSPAQLQSRSTVLVDLCRNDDQLLKRMSATWRRYIRKADRDGVKVRPGTAADLGRFYELYTLTAERDGFIPRPLPYLQRLWHRLAPGGLSDLFLAEVDGQVEAGLLPLRFGRRAWYLYGATSEAALRVHAMYLLQWHTMRWARDHDCEVYDMWGAPDDAADKDDPLAGVYYFKQGFGGRHVRWVGPYDYVTSPLLYRLWNAARPRLLAALRRLR